MGLRRFGVRRDWADRLIVLVIFMRHGSTFKRLFGILGLVPVIVI